MSKDKKSKEAVSEEPLNEKSDAASQEHNVQALNPENRATKIRISMRQASRR